jgi:hypothetical protein
MAARELFLRVISSRVLRVGSAFAAVRMGFCVIGIAYAVLIFLRRGGRSPWSMHLFASGSLGSSRPGA